MRELRSWRRYAGHWRTIYEPWRRRGVNKMPLKIVFKADVINKAKLYTVYPNLVTTVQAFMDTGEKLDLPYDD